MAAAAAETTAGSRLECKVVLLLGNSNRRSLLKLKGENTRVQVRRGVALREAAIDDLGDLDLPRNHGPSCAWSKQQDK